MDAVLIANTYHELNEPQKVLRRLSQSMRQGGRLVVVDRSDAERRVSPDAEEFDLRSTGFQIISREDRFIVHTNDDIWWLITSVKR